MNRHTQLIGELRNEHNHAFKMKYNLKSRNQLTIAIIIAVF